MCHCRSGERQTSACSYFPSSVDLERCTLFCRTLCCLLSSPLHNLVLNLGSVNCYSVFAENIMYHVPNLRITHLLGKLYVAHSRQLVLHHLGLGLESSHNLLGLSCQHERAICRRLAFRREDNTSHHITSHHITTPRRPLRLFLDVEVHWGSV